MKRFLKNLSEGRQAAMRALEALTDARSHFWLAAEESQITANQIYLENLVDHLSKTINAIDFENQTFPHISGKRSVNSCLAFMRDDCRPRETDYRIIESAENQAEV